MSFSRILSRISFSQIFTFASPDNKTAEQVLLETQYATLIALVGVALYAHTFLPLVPAALLYWGLRAYHLKVAGRAAATSELPGAKKEAASAGGF